MPRHGDPGDPHGLLAQQDATKPFRPTGQQGGGLLGLLADFAPVVGGVKALALDAPREFRAGNTGMGLLSLASLIPGVPSARQVRGLFHGVEGLKDAGLRMFARSEGRGLRTVASITPNPKGGGGVKVSLFDESAEHGASELPSNVIEFDSMDEAVKALESEDGFFRGFRDIPVGEEALMESRFERVAERGLFSESATDPVQARARAGARRAERGAGGFLPR